MLAFTSQEEAGGLFSRLKFHHDTTRRGFLSSRDVNYEDTVAIKEDRIRLSSSDDIVTLLRACAKQKDIKKGTRVHAEIQKKGFFGRNYYVESALVNMYAKCGAFLQAVEVLDELPARDGVSWSALITGYAQYGQGEEALKCFEHMKTEGLSPDSVTFISILKACGSIGASEKGEQICNEITTQGLLKEQPALCSALVDMYVKFGALSKAASVLYDLPVRDVASWSALIAGFAQQGQGEEALKCFEEMQREGHAPNVVTFICILKACRNMGATDKGEQIHADILRLGLLSKHIDLGTVLLDMYVKLGAFKQAAQLFDELPVRDSISWSTLIGGYAQLEQGGVALVCFEQMQHEGLSPDIVTFIGLLKACASLTELEKGEQIHMQIIRQGLLEKDIAIGTALVDMYAKCGALEKAAGVLDELPIRSVVCWSALIAGYAQQGQDKKALKCLERMQGEGMSPNAITFTCILKACGSLGAIEKGEFFVDEILRQGLLLKDHMLGNAVVDMYAKCGMLNKAAQVLRELSGRSVVSWNSLIAGHVQQDQGEEALACFDQMQREGHFPDAVTIICILKACGSIGALEKGEQIHNELERQGLLRNNVVLGTALVDMYAKCGALAKAAHVNNDLSFRNVVSWSALITGYAQQGKGKEAFACLECMKRDGFSPNAVTLASLFSACGRSGLLDECQRHFERMITSYSVTPNVDHYTSIIDLFARTGELDEALALIKKMPCLDHLPLWHALLAACKKCGNLKIGKFAFENALAIDENHAAAYTLMTEIYAAAGMHDDLNKVADMRKKRCANTLLLGGSRNL